MTQFQGFFPSNSSMDVHPDNTASKYTVELKTPLELDGDYEVGLSQIQYPRTWDNIRQGRNKFTVKWKLGEEQFEVNRQVPVGYYETITDLVKMIQQRLRSLAIGKLKGIKIDYYSASRRVKVTNKNVQFENMEGKSFPVSASIEFHDDLARLLGFREGTVIAANGISYAPFASIPSGGFSFMHVYCNLIEQQIVGDANAPCLRTIHVASDPDGTNVSTSFPEIYYMSITKRYINSIEFRIADDTGTLVEFDHGKINIVLQFRSKNYK